MNKKNAFKPKVVTIYSTGLLGSSIGLSLKNASFPGTVIGLSSPSSIKTSLSLNCIDEGYGYDALAEVIKKTDILILCSPIMVIIETIKKLGKLELPRNLIITDVGSTKSSIAKIAQESLPDHVHFIGGHPMAGSEKSGPSASDPYLFQNAIYVLSPLTIKPLGIDLQLAGFLDQYLGCRHVFLNPKTHDRIAGTVSHIPHILAVALVNFAQEVENSTPGTMQFAAGGFRDITRIASSPYPMWHDIFLTNKKNILPLLDSCIKNLEKLKHELTEDNLESSFNNASGTRSRMPLSSKGFIKPLDEILVVANDEPGIIASISGILYKEGVNIKDIEVVKVREGEGGTIKLGFESAAFAKSAVGLLNKSGFFARERN